VPKSSLSWTDTGLNKQNAFYIVRAYTNWNVEGLASAVARAGADDLSYVYSDDKAFKISYSNGVIPSSVTISILRNSAEENETILRSYSIHANDPAGEPVNFDFSGLASIYFNDPAPSSGAPGVSRAPAMEIIPYGIFWHNGVEWAYLGGVKTNDEISCSVSKPGNYQLRTVKRTTEFAKLASWPKIITPNGDGINDDFNFTFDNPARNNVEGKIFDLQGCFITYMSLTGDSWIIWNGQNQNGSAVVPGIYLYQVKCGTKVFNGTIVVAR
jgi:gliding motility-associated-like protein